MAENGPSRIVVMLHVTPTEEGGRRTGVFDGYRSSFSIGNEGLNNAPLKLEGITALAPGQSAPAVLQPLFPEYWQHVAIGDRLVMREGARTVGVAEVLEIH